MRVYKCCVGRAVAIDASCGAACPAAERVGRIFVSGEEDAADELRAMQVSVFWRLHVECVLRLSDMFNEIEIHLQLRQ